MICNQDEGMCIAGVLAACIAAYQPTPGTSSSKAPVLMIITRKTSFRHGLRTDAATRFEKGTDISATVTVLRRAAILIREICGGRIASEIVDIYPDPRPKTEVSIKYHFLKTQRQELPPGLGERYPRQPGF